MSISAQDRACISAAILKAETKTSGEIICVLAQSSVDAKALPIFIAAAVALGVPWLLVALTTLPVLRILLIQGVVFVVLTALLCLPAVRVALVPRAARRAVAHRVAMEQFAIRGLAHKDGHTGILIFVSLAERYARIIADESIAARVPQAAWQRAVDALVAQMRDGRVADGFITAIDICGSILTAHFPRTGSIVDNLPSRIHVI
jgi:putative membrane protein